MTEDNIYDGVPNERSIPELESLLRKKMGDDLIVEKQRVTDFLQPGENYGSSILKVDVVIRREKSNKKEEIHLIAKVPPPTQQQRDFFDSPFTFKKESFMYTTILPTYKKFERDYGTSDEDIFDVGPKFYGSRMSLNSDEIFDDNAVIILENLKTSGYYSGNRYTGLDLLHSRLAIEAMARFHALGIDIKMKNPDFFETLKAKSKCLQIKNRQDWTNIKNEMFKRAAKEDSMIGEYYETGMKAMEYGRTKGNWNAVPEEPWSTIIHADFWINNLMFHRDEKTGLPDDIKFVDFQNYLFFSPTRELTFFLGSGVDHEVSMNHIEKLLDLYYETFVTRLKKMGCDTESYTRKKFDERVAEDGYIEFDHSAFMLKIITKNADANDPESRNLTKVMLSESSPIFYSRLRDLIQGYSKRGWFLHGS